jgi:predicted nuclease with TOPRIM domain
MSDVDWELCSSGSRHSLDCIEGVPSISSFHDDVDHLRELLESERLRVQSLEQELDRIRNASEGEVASVINELVQERDRAARLQQQVRLFVAQTVALHRRNHALEIQNQNLRRELELNNLGLAIQGNECVHAEVGEVRAGKKRLQLRERIPAPNCTSKKDWKAHNHRASYTYRRKM